MQHALALAKKAQDVGEVPVGAVLVAGDKLIAEGYNCPISTFDPTAHAEIIALRRAASQIKNYRLVDLTLYVTIEPCAMCAGAIVHARLARVVFGAFDPKAGAVGSVFNLLDGARLNHKPQCTSGILAQECAAMLQDFFKQRRKRN